MRKLLLSLLLLTAVSQTKAQSQSALLYLLIQPSTHANGMAGTSVATVGHTPLSALFNPAHVGFCTFEHSLNFEFYPSKTNLLPQFNLEDLTYDAEALVVGFDFRRLNERIPISVGFGYSKINVNYGEQIIMDETGPEAIGTFSSSDKAEVWSAGIAIDYYIRAGLGFNFKNMDSNLAPFGAGAELGDGSATAKAHDFGMLVQLPILETVSKLTKQKFTISENFYPFFVPGFGFSKSNIGDEISYIDSSQADPLPRVARMGVSMNIGMAYRSKNTHLKLFSFEWSSEAEDELVMRDESGISYEGGIGKIDFIENVVKSNANANVINSHGWEASAFDILSIRRGRHKDPGGSSFYDTRGFGVSFISIIRFAKFLNELELINSELIDNPFVSFINDHVDIQYDHSKLDGPESPLDDTTFNSVIIRLF